MIRRIIMGQADPRRHRYSRWQCHKCGATLISDNFYKDVSVRHSMTTAVFDYTCPACGQQLTGALVDFVQDAYYTNQEVEEMTR